MIHYDDLNEFFREKRLKMITSQNNYIQAFSFQIILSDDCLIRNKYKCVFVFKFLVLQLFVVSNFKKKNFFK